MGNSGFIKIIVATVTLMVIVAVSGCASYGVVENQQKLTAATPTLKQHQSLSGKERINDITVILAFSGGGSRAAALSYGVLKQLDSTSLGKQGRTLLDEVDNISAVSGGSITAAYYGLVGKNIFNGYLESFLYQDNERLIVRKASSLSHLSSSKGRSESAIEYFDELLFNGSQIKQFSESGGPNIIINSSDLGRGVRLSFTPEYFGLLCSDVKAFPVARAVVASSAVPLLFNPIVVQNYAGCSEGTPQWLLEAKKRLAKDDEMSLVIEKLETLTDKENRKYIHLVDGGITDNLGLRAIYETVELAGGAVALQRQSQRQYPQTVLVISVDASTEPQPSMDTSLEEPGVTESITAITDIQIHRYNAATLKLFESKLNEWAMSVSTTTRKVTPHFVKLRLQDLTDQAEKEYFNNIPTSLSLTQEQADKLIKKAGELLTENKEFKEALKALENSH